MNDESNKTPKTRRSLVARFLIALCVVVVPIASCPMTRNMISILAAEHRMRKPEVYQEVARQLALLCQTVPENTRTLRGGHSWLPKVVRNLDPSYATVEPNYCRIEMGGGFYHFGYHLARDATNSTRESNVWELRIYDDDSSSVYTKITLKTNEELSDEQCVQLVTEGIKDTISERPGEIRPYEDAYYFLIKLAKREAARELCDDAIEAIPEHWWPRLTAVLMDSTGPTAETATDRFKKWVDANPSLPHYVYLSYFYDAIGNGPDACQAAAEALEQPFTTGEYNSKNCWFLTYTATINAFDNGCYETVIQIGDKILQAGESPNYLYFDVLGMKAAAHFLLNDQDQAVALLNNANPSKPDTVLSRDMCAEIAALKMAIAEKDCEAVKAWVRPAAGELEPYHDLPIEKILGMPATQETP